MQTPIGMAVASGLYAVSVAATILSLVGLEVLGWFFRNSKNSERTDSAPIFTKDRERRFQS